MPASSFSPRCKSCGQNAPIVFHGIETRCAACGAPRLPLGPNVSLAGEPSRYGGLAAGLAGWAALVLGLSVSLGVLLLLQSIWPASFVGYAFALPLAVASLFFGLLLIFGGRHLRRSGQEKRLRVRRDAIRALVAHRDGSVTSAEAARALGIEEPEADALLTEMSRESTGTVRLEVDDDGTFRYDFRGADERFRVLEQQAEAESVSDEAAPLRGTRARS